MRISALSKPILLHITRRKTGFLLRIIRIKRNETIFPVDNLWITGQKMAKISRFPVDNVVDNLLKVRVLACG